MTIWRTLTRLFGAAVLLCIAPVVRAAPLADDTSLHEVAASLSPGAFAWDGNAVVSLDVPMTIVVSITLQRMYVYSGSALVGVSTVSTGRPGHRTPLGSFQILEKARWHRSNLYSSAPMPFMQRLTWDGIAIHAGHNPGYPASHGCVRIPAEFAKALFEMTSLGSLVSVTDYPFQAPIYLRVEGLELAEGGGDAVMAGADAPSFSGQVAAWTPAPMLRLDYARAVFFTDYR